MACMPTLSELSQYRAVYEVPYGIIEMSKLRHSYYSCHHFEERQTQENIDMRYSKLSC